VKHVGCSRPADFFPIMTMPLCQLPAGASGRVQSIAGPAEFSQRMREMGIGEAAVVRKLSGSGPFICLVNRTRLVLGHNVARLILVQPNPGA